MEEDTLRLGDLLHPDLLAPCRPVEQIDMGVLVRPAVKIVVAGLDMLRDEAIDGAGMVAQHHFRALRGALFSIGCHVSASYAQPALGHGGVTLRGVGIT